MTHETTKVIVSIKDGTVWTQIFEEDKIISSYTSDNEVNALVKAAEFLVSHNEGYNK